MFGMPPIGADERIATLERDLYTIVTAPKPKGLGLQGDAAPSHTIKA